MSLTSGSGVAPLHIAVSKGYDGLLDILFSHDAPLGTRDDHQVTSSPLLTFQQTVLHLAAASNKPRLMELLLRHPQSSEILNARDSEIRTALHAAALADSIPVGKLLTFGNISSLVALLIHVGANVNVQDSNGETALHIATLRGSREISRMLVNAHTDMSLVSNSGATARNDCHDILTQSSFSLLERSRRSGRLASLSQSRRKPQRQFPKYSRKDIRHSLTSVTLGVDVQTFLRGNKFVWLWRFTVNDERGWKPATLLRSSEITRDVTRLLFYFYSSPSEAAALGKPH